MIIKLSNCEVEIIDKVTWGMQEQIRSAMYGGLKIQSIETGGSISGLNSTSLGKYKALEICIKKIKNSDGTESQYSKEWMDNLSIEDGDNIMAAIDVLTSPKKK